MKGGKGIVTCRKEWRLQLIAYIEGSWHQGKGMGGNFWTMEELCKKGGEIGERRQHKDGTDLVFYISHMLCLFGQKFSPSTHIIVDKCVCEIFRSKISTD